MIGLPNKILDQDSLDFLKKKQNQIDNQASYKDAIDEAKRLWTTTNKTSKAFLMIKATLTKMSSGEQRCCYCEDSYANQIEHFQPKSIFPELCFVWENYLYACNPCNSSKSNQFAIFKKENNQFHKIKPFQYTKHEQDYTFTKPPKGKSVLINPRFDNPLDYIELDIISTFKFFPIDKNKTSQAYQRASYTIKVLRLNDRSDMIEARKSAFQSYLLRLMYYSIEKEKNSHPQKLVKLKNAIQKYRHPTVWKEMIRWFQDKNLNRVLEIYHKDVYKLFKKNPEVLDW